MSPGPLLLRLVPRDAGPARIPGLPLEVRRRAVVHDAPVERPAPRPAVVVAHARRVVLRRVLDPVRAAWTGSRPRRIAARVDPVPGGGRAVVLQLGERVEPLPGRQVEAVDLLGELVELGLRRILVLHGQRHQRLGELAPVLLVELLHALEHLGQDPVVVPGLAVGGNHGVLPLHPSAAVDEGPVLLDPVGRRDHEDLGPDRLRVRSRPPPELGARRRQRVHDDEPLELAERLHDLVGVGPDAGGGHPREDDALHLALQRLVVDRDPGGVRRGLGHELERVLVLRRRRVAIPALEEADHEVPVVRAEEVPRVGVELLGRALLHVVVQVLLAGRGDAQVPGQDLPRDRVVGVALDVGVAALGVHAAARPPHVAEQAAGAGRRSG